MPDQKTTGRTLTPQASGPHVLLSRLSEHPSQQRHKKTKRVDLDRKPHQHRTGSCRIRDLEDFCSFNHYSCIIANFHFTILE
ncbi:hypothetical protein NQZ68_029116 [Dissostichus eleginoides]|nr:hypothetical protein NQZ68_029116 [Dissostichus eleginoides]